jgi:hypothetical protein
MLTKAVPSPPLQLFASRKPFDWPPVGEAEAALSAPGALLEWEMRDYQRLGVRYPLDMLPDTDCRRATDFSSISRMISPTQIPDITYPAKNSIRFAPAGASLNMNRTAFEDYRIHRICPSCGTPFRPQDQFVEIPVGATGAKYLERGGICYRFAIVLDCGKDMPGPEEDGEPRDPKVDVSFLETCRSALALDLYEASLYS